MAHRFLHSGEFSDTTVTCQGRTCRTHRMMLSAMSSFFRAACAKNFKEGVNGVIELPDNDPDIVNSMLHFIYNGHYSKEQKSLSQHIKTWVITDKYDIY